MTQELPAPAWLEEISNLIHEYDYPYNEVSVNHIMDRLKKIEHSMILELAAPISHKGSFHPRLATEPPNGPPPPPPPGPGLIDPASDELSIINPREIQYIRDEAEKVLRRYNGDNDLIPDAPVVTWADYQLLDLVTRMISMVETMAVRLVELQKTVARKF